MLCRRCGLCSRSSKKKINIVLRERMGGKSVADPDLGRFLALEGGGGGAVLIYLPCPPFSLQSFLLFSPKIRGGGGPGPSPRSVTGNVHDLGQDGARTTAHYDNSHELLYTSRDVVFLPSDVTSGRTARGVLDPCLGIGVPPRV